MRDIFNKDLMRCNPFRGSSIKKLTCTKCQFTSYIKVEEMNEIIIHLPEIKTKFGYEFPSQSKSSIEYCMQKVFYPEILDQVYCTKCSYDFMVNNEGFFQGNIDFKNDM